ncbi:MAG: DUF192 domain-containing protein [Anaerolineales bacterium]
MKEVQITKKTEPVLPPIRAKYCDTFLCRLQGFMFRKQIGAGEGLLLVGNQESRLDSAIHMLGVPIDLAVFWMDNDQRIVDRRLARKWRPLYVPRAPARYVLELSPVRYDDFIVGETLDFEEISSR